VRNAKRLRPISAVSIAGSDSGGGAGIQADLLTFAAHGVYGATVVTAGTAQNTRGVVSVEPFTVGFVAEQLDAVFSDLAPAAVKIGMLGDAPHVRAVAEGLARHGARNVVLDPVFFSTSGAVLLSAAGVRALRSDLLPLCDVVTPNLQEAAILARREVRTASEQEDAAGRLVELGARAALVKGGHGPGDRIRDVLRDGERMRVFENRRVATRATHGTGCVLSAAIAANLALGFGMEEAVRRAIRYLRATLRRGVFPGAGMGVPGLPARLRPRSRIGSRSPSKPSRRSRSGGRRGRRHGPGHDSSRPP
jgi:hydroxymethylpyrimidine/phosphomethylpyrimidine kinase